VRIIEEVDTMRRLTTVVAVLCLAPLLAGVALADTYNIDTTHTQVLFKVKHLGISTVTGNFGTFSGSFDFDPESLEAGGASVTIDVASIDTGVEDRDTHLRSPDFFEVEKHPEITFKSTKVQNVKDNTFELVGNLTIRGVTKPVTLEVEVGGTATDPWGNEKAAFTAETKINRQEFGLTWSKLLETGGLVVGNEVRILLEVEGNKAKG
jgi:polyisoprenoid-binding protein YceI